MSTLTINRIRNFLDKEFKGKIDLSNLHKKCSEDDRISQFRTRALGAVDLSSILFKQHSEQV
jgi:hypothetical protein